ncbi:MAG: cation-translocating P-type ATPase [Tissierellia bacterium]|nr:cation-translocating P-type ATPase [Tissierellia bacterium]
MNRLIKILFGLKMTIVSGIFLLISISLWLMKKTLPIDPAWGAIIISGTPMLILAVYRLIKEKWISSALLISMAMLASIMIGEIFAAGEVAFIMALGALLEEKTLEKAKKGLRELIDLTPIKGRKLVGKTETIVLASDIESGDIIRVLPGEKIPTDGIIIEGSSSIDQSIMTGESLPIDKTIGDEVFCGSLNQFGSIDYRATNVGSDSSLYRLINLVKEAESKKAPMQRIADTWAVWLVPIALIVAVFGFVLNRFWGYDFTISLTRAVTVLVVFCPCALALATPTSIVAAIGQATKKGVIIKSGEALEYMGKVNVIAFDKTGTLSYGVLKVSDILPIDTTETKLLEIAANAEQKSEHPLAKAIIDRAKIENVKFYNIEDFQMFPGKGVISKIDGEEIICGNKKFLKEKNIAIEKENEINNLAAEGKALVYIAKDNKFLGAIALSDSLRPDAKETLNRLNSLNTKTILLTGDNKNAAAYLAKTCEIEDVYSELLPEDKMKLLKDLQNEKNIVCMIGDGVNDAPALKMADVSIAMGSIGSDIAIDASDILLMNEDLKNIVYITKLSQETVKTIKKNISLSMLINLFAIVLSVLGVLTPITGALVHNAGSVLVVLNAAMLYDKKFEY